MPVSKTVGLTISPASILLILDDWLDAVALNSTKAYLKELFTFESNAIDSDTDAK